MFCPTELGRDGQFIGVSVKCPGQKSTTAISTFIHLLIYIPIYFCLNIFPLFVWIWGGILKFYFIDKVNQYKNVNDTYYFDISNNKQYCASGKVLINDTIQIKKA